jgi:hypothetical protein
MRTFLRGIFQMPVSVYLILSSSKDATPVVQRYAFFAASMARQMRSGVAGMSIWRMP